MSFGMRKARPIHLEHKNCTFKHFNCVKAASNVGADILQIFSEVKTIMKKASADVASDFEAVEMLKHVVFMS